MLAPNADIMTLDGTNTWVLRDPDSSRSVVVDPGPSIAAHLDAIDAAAAPDGRGSVAVVLLTHHHADHSEAAREYAERHGCGVRALDPAYRLGSEGLGEGDVVAVGGLEVHVVATPGHTADSLSFVVPQDRAVLTGDTVLGRGTTVVAHPDGQLGAYLSSLQRLHALCGEQGITTVWPGHGPVIDDALGALDLYLAHRQQRLDQVQALRDLHAIERERGASHDTLPARSSSSSTPTSTRCCGVRPSCRCAPSWPTSPTGDLDDAVLPALGVDHDVVDEGVAPRLVEGELGEAALGGQERQHLRAPARCRAAASTRPRSRWRRAARRRRGTPSPGWGPASRTHIRTLSPTLARSGAVSYWKARPLKATRSGCSAATAASSTSSAPSCDVSSPRKVSEPTSTHSWSTGSSPGGSMTTAPARPAAMWLLIGIVEQWYIQIPARRAVKR